ncbi:MAG: carboxypeptidase-like regulatory domain-containing protein [Flavobacteriales bacterium]|nr:carboxypeptidase-like regulatory domain-containing protein [Flavobacteriales bacterium]MCB9363250.1 carboxypeptidase-like regulatory domain-containing protein [Flavobacteriales bacterium]
MKSTILFLFLFITNLFFAFGQADTNYNISGTVVDGKDNSSLIGAHIISSRKVATKTNELGLFELMVSEGDTLAISYIGYKALTYIIPKNKAGKYLTKFNLLKDSISLQEVEIFPWPSYDDFKKAFEELDFKDQEIKMAGVKMYRDRNIEPYNYTLQNLLKDKNIISFMYDRLLDKEAKLKRRINRRTETIEKAAQKQTLEN